MSVLQVPKSLTRLASLLLFVAPAAFAQNGPGGLLVAPTRVVFEGHTRSAALTLLNTGKVPATYRIFFVQMRMSETGDLKEIQTAEPGEQFADEYVRFSPHQVRLEPGVSQTVRLQVRKPAQLPDGEYRSHLVLREVPASVAPETGGAAPGKGLNIQMIPIYGVAVPVIIRQGQTQASVTLERPTLRSGNAGEAIVRTTLSRTGNRSVYGTILATFVPDSGAEVKLALLKGVGVYTPNPRRIIQFALRAPPGVQLSRGTLRLAYLADPGDELLASTELRLP